MTDEQMKELAELRVAIQDLKYQLIQKHDLCELTDEEISQVYKEVSEPFGEKRLYEIHDFARAILRKASEK
jgi:FKBP-type peptidyl-prolyl cis-trans isomerase (trigger factor)